MNEISIGHSGVFDVPLGSLSLTDSLILSAVAVIAFIALIVMISKR